MPAPASAADLSWSFQPEPDGEADAAARRTRLETVLTSPLAAVVKRNARRTVWRIPDPAGGAVFVKEYRPDGRIDALMMSLGRNPARREWNLLNKLWAWSRRQGRHLVCPEPLALGVGSGVSVLVTREVPSQGTLDEWVLRELPRLAGPARSAVLATLGAELAEALAALDGADICAFDLHPGNFLVAAGPAGPMLVLLDLHQAGGRQTHPGGVGAAPEGVPLALAWMNNSLGPSLSTADRLRAWRGFVASGRTAYPPPLVAEPAAIRDVLARSAAFRRAFFARRDRRADEHGRYFARIKAGGWRGSVLLTLRRYGDNGVGPPLRSFTLEAWRRALADPDRLRDVGRVLKDSRSVKVQTLDLPAVGAAAVCKSPRRKKRINLLFDLFRPSRARRAWRLGHALLARGLPTPIPLAVMERRTLGHLRDSFLLTELVPDAVDLDTLMGRGAGSRPAGTELRRLAWDLARLMRRLHDEGFVHRDFKGGNILVRPGAQGPELLLIDMDGIALRGELTERDRRPALVRLAASSLDWPGAADTDRARFLRSYLAGWGPSADWRAWWRALAPAVAAKRNRTN